VISLLGLFVSAFLAATLLPLSSELLLLGLLASGEQHSLWLWGMATLGNTLGSLVNWAIGRYLLHYRERPWFPVNPAQLQKYQHWFQRYGRWSLLFAWLPAGGDVLTVIAGIMRVNPWLFLLLVGLGKGARYAILIALALHLL
jgi:membrane protein YqaA with SNARE-associated domain